MQREQQYVAKRLHDRRDAAKRQRAGEGVHDREGDRHVQEHLARAFGCNDHGANIGAAHAERQLDVAMSAFNAV